MPDITEMTIRDEIEALNRKIERLRGSLADAEQRRDALALTLEHFQPPAVKRTRRQADIDVSPDELRGKAIGEALLLIANRGGGILRSTVARELLVEAGVIRGTQAGNALWTALDRSKNFVREAKGRYRLLNAVAERPSLRALITSKDAVRH